MGKWIGIGLAVLGLITIAFIVAAYLYPGFREATRDIAVVILAVMQMIAVILMIAILLAIMYAVWTINRLARNTVLPKIDMLTGKLDQVIENTQSITANVKDTTATASTTTVYIAEQVVSPVIRVASLLAGVRGAARFLARRDVRESDLG